MHLYFQVVPIEMSNTAKSHSDMLQLCCGICGLKKNPQQLRLICECVLSRLNLSMVVRTMI